MNSNIKKTFYFLKRNGIRNTFHAVLERLEEKKNAPYEYQPVPEDILEQQRKELEGLSLPLISIVVPAYRTPKDYLIALIESVRNQSYENWELILADASGNDEVAKVQKLYQDIRIKHFYLEKNAGISENTNAGILKATGSYIALLDHDDVLTKDALYEMVSALLRNSFQELDSNIVMVYSDEDKCNEDESIYFDHHQKLDFNKDLLLTNNYICHFSMIRADVMKQLLLRQEYDGAQDFDLFLRVMRYCEDHQGCMKHVAKVLYHWRSHELSTAANPQSKLYAYEAGKRAISTYLSDCGIEAEVLETPHLGFYYVKYTEELIAKRTDLAGVVRKRIGKGKVVPTIFTKEKKPMWQGLPKGFSGYMHRANLQQDAEIALLSDTLLKPEWAECATKVMKEQLEKCPTIAGELLKEIEKVISGINKEIIKHKNELIDLSIFFELVPTKWKAQELYRSYVLMVSEKVSEQIHQSDQQIIYDPYWCD